MSRPRVPEGSEVCVTREQIAARAAELGAVITTWADEAEARTGKPVLAVCILRGGLFFFSDLVRHIGCSVEPAFCRAQAYCVESNQLGSEVRVFPNDIQASGRAVLVVDDICDSGKTLAKMESTLRAQGAAEICSAVVICRKLENAAYSPTWTAFPFAGDEWLVGYGMDSHDSYRNLPDIYRIKK